jgi:hypothetical protein
MALSMLVNGYIIGWSVAWPPGPINAERIRRGLLPKERGAALKFGTHIFAHPRWQIATEAINAAVMVWFTIRLLLHFP